MQNLVIVRPSRAFLLTSTCQGKRLRKSHQDKIQRLEAEAGLERQALLLEQQRRDSKILEFEAKVCMTFAEGWRRARTYWLWQVEQYEKEKLAKAK